MASLGVSKPRYKTSERGLMEYLGWEEVGDQLKDQPIDPIREQMLATETEAARRRIPEAIRQAYSVVVTVSESNAIHAFKVVVTDEPLFTTIKADRRSRIQETAISSEAMMPGGPYDLWRKDEPSRRVKDLVGAFAQFPKLPKMLRRKEILDTVVQGVQEGIWVAQVVRPDRTVRTFRRTAIDEAALNDSSLEVLLPEAATLSGLVPDLLEHQKQSNGIQDLADQIPDISKAAVGNDLKFNVRVEFGGETAPDSKAVERINRLLSEVSDELRLN